MPLPEGLLEKFRLPHGLFIETGSHRGDGIQCALDAGYETIYSCDISEFAYGWCCHRFREIRTKVNLHLADSRIFLRDLLRTHFDPEGNTRSTIGSPATFWLDAHWSGGDGELDGRDAHLMTVGKPLLEELEIIARHPVKSHVLLIDDVRLFGRDEFFPTRDEIEAAIFKVNSEYQIMCVGSALEDDEILIARLEESVEAS